MEKKKKKKNYESIFSIIIMLIIGGAVGWFAGEYLGKSIEHISILDDNAGVAMVIFGVTILVAIFLQLIIHELGHMVFGLLTGYKFLSFRVGNIMLIKKENGYRLSTFSIPGTGGQCLMSPQKVDENMPFLLYNLGGGLFNLLASGVAVLVLKLMPYTSGILTFILYIFFFIGVLFAITNLLPLNIGITNDGYNIMTMIKNKNSRKIFSMQLKLMEYLTFDKRIKDIPENLIEMPSDDELETTLGIANAVLYCNKLIDEQKFDEAKEKIDFLLNSDYKIINVHKEIIKADRIYCELVSEEPSMELIQDLYDKDLKKMMKALKDNISTPRFFYAVELLYNKDLKRAEKALSKFDKIKGKYPYAGEVESELELINIVKVKYEKTSV